MTQVQLAEENFSRLLKEKQCENLQPAKYLYSVCSKVFLIVAVIELAIGIVGNFLNPETEILEAMLINASVWLALYAVAIGKVLYDKNRLKKIKQSGVCVDAEIKDMLPAAWIRVANYNSCRIRCRFWYRDRKYIVVSSYYLLNPFILKEDLHAVAYVDQENPNKCVVEVYVEQTI